MPKKDRVVHHALRLLLTAVIALPALAVARPESADPAGAAISRRDARAGQGGARIEKVIVLHPSAETEVQKRFFVVLLTDGTRIVTTEQPKPDLDSPAAEAQPIEWTVDLSRGTYTARFSELTERDNQMLERVKRRVEKEWRESHDKDESWTPMNSAGWAYSHAAETWEPGAFVGFAGLTRTEADLFWSECGTDGQLYNDGFNPRCYSNPYTFAATTWYTNGCLPWNPPSSHSWQLQGEVTGYYMNWDFWDDTKPTYSQELVRVFGGQGGFGNGYVSHAMSGEMSWLLSGRDIPGQRLTRPSSCATRFPTSGGGGGGTPGGGGTGTPGGGGGTTTCVPVHDGSSGAYLGTCCGSTTPQIVDCAAGYL